MFFWLQGFLYCQGGVGEVLATGVERTSVFRDGGYNESNIKRFAAVIHTFMCLEVKT